MPSKSGGVKTIGSEPDPIIALILASSAIVSSNTTTYPVLASIAYHDNFLLKGLSLKISPKV